jgi:hypothetical protein
VRYETDLDFTDNHILRKPGGWFARTSGYYPWDPVYIDLTHNWWGTDDADEISEWIYDGYDQENDHVYIVFEPFLGGPIATENKTWSDVKSLYDSSNP